MSRSVLWLLRVSLPPIKDGLQQCGGGLYRNDVTTETCSIRGFVRGGFSPQTSARQRLPPGADESSTGSVVIRATLPRRHCLEAQKNNKNLGR